MSGSIQTSNRKGRAAALPLCLMLPCITLLSPPPAMAQMEHTFQMWQQVQLSFPTGINGLRAYVNTNVRENNNMGALGQIITRGYLLHRINRHMRAGGGYAWSHVYSPFTQENRLFQQVDFLGHRKRFSWTLTTQLEQRMFEHLPEASVRWHEKIRITVPITKKHYALASEDLYINLNNVPGGPDAGIDQNRFSAGIGRQLSEKMKLEVAYQNQYVNRSEQFDDRTGHTILTSLYYDF